MRHRVAGRKLGRTTAHRVAMTRNMAASLIEHERIVTTIQKAKTVKPFVEKLVTMGKDPAQHSRRRAFSKLRDKDATGKLFDVLGERYKDRQGGYARVMKAGFRYGDMAPMAIIELVDRDPDAKGAGDRARIAAEEAAAEAE